jgi:hypothetical protein
VEGVRVGPNTAQNEGHPHCAHPARLLATLLLECMHLRAALAQAGFELLSSSANEHGQVLRFGFFSFVDEHGQVLRFGFFSFVNEHGQVLRFGFFSVVNEHGQVLRFGFFSVVNEHGQVLRFGRRFGRRMAMRSTNQTAPPGNCSQPPRRCAMTTG